MMIVLGKFESGRACVDTFQGLIGAIVSVGLDPVDWLFIKHIAHIMLLGT
jgi:hypothetical protein